MNVEINQVRTELLNVMAEAGRAALRFDTMSAAALAAIPNTEPQQYVIAGTPPMIAKLLPAVNVSSAVSTAVGEPVLTNERIIEIAGQTRTAESRDGDYILPISFARAIEREVAARLAAPTQVSAPQADPMPRPTDDDLWDATLRDRDTYQDWADKLAEAVSVHFGVDIGEHSNMNCPWSEALDAINNAVASPYPRLAAVRDWVATAPHGENCHLTDDPEFDRCLCGKDNVLDIIDGASLEATQASAAQEVRAVPEGVSRDDIERAIYATEYKYFGDYEFDENQRQAVDTLVKCAQFVLAAPTSTSTAPAALDEGKWISVDERLPEVGAWCNVLVDRELGDFFTRLNKPRYDVYAAQLREVDSEGYASWQRWKMSDGGPMGSLTMVSHWMPLPATPASQPSLDEVTGAGKGKGDA